MKLYKQVREYLDKEKTIKNPAYQDAVWWADFTVDGRRYRISTDTKNKTEASKTAKKKEAQANAGKLSANSQSFARLTLSEATEKYLASRKLELQASSLAKEKQLCVKLKEHFGSMRLNQIGADSEQILAYREWRSRTAGNAIINMEMGILRRILKRAKLWHLIADDIKPLKEPSTIGRALSPEQKTTLLGTAALKPEWQNAYYASVIALSTTMRGCEVKGLRWQDVNLAGDPATLTIHKSKTAAGERVIPLTSEAYEVFVKLRARAELFGPVSPEHFIFARFRSVSRFEGNAAVERKILNFDPSTPIGSWKKAWRKLTERAGLKGLRFHDCRHTTITDLLTNPNVSIQTTKAIAGHVSARMVDRYSHIHLEAKRTAVDALTVQHLPTQSNDDAVNAVDLPC
jgi:integrase